jgi:uncharacterized membrane protein YdjX (TVP38/TMEM64 family)
MSAISKLKLPAIVLLLTAAVATVVFLPVKNYLFLFLQWIEQLGPWGAVWIAIIYIPACLLFVPGSLITLGAGFAFGPVVGTIAVSVGSVAGATAAFLMGRTLAREWIKGYTAHMPRFRAIDRAVAENGFRIVLLTRLSPAFPFNLLNYAFGLTNVSLRDYVLASWIGMLPGTIMFVSIGSAFNNLAEAFTGERQRTTAEWILLGVGLIATVAVTVFIKRIANRALKQSIADDKVQRDEPPSPAGAAESDRKDAPADAH